jgi:hypothetical protein
MNVSVEVKIEVGVTVERVESRGQGRSAILICVFANSQLVPDIPIHWATMTNLSLQTELPRLYPKFFTHTGRILHLPLKLTIRSLKEPNTSTALERNSLFIIPITL